MKRNVLISLLFIIAAALIVVFGADVNNSPMMDLIVLLGSFLCFISTIYISCVKGFKFPF